MDRNRRSAIVSWIFVAALVGLTLALAALQYRSIDEISRQEQERMRRNLASGLERVSEDFNTAVHAAAAALLLPETVDGGDREQAWLAHYAQWRQAEDRRRLFVHIVRVVREGAEITPREPDQAGGRFFTPAPEPGWSPLLEQMRLRSQPGYSGPDGPLRNETPDLLETPWWGGEEPGSSQPREWLLCQIDLGYVGDELLPALLNRHLGAGAAAEYRFQVNRGFPAGATLIPGVTSDPIHANAADGRVALLTERRAGRGRGEGVPARWELLVQHREGSVESAVSSARLRSIGATTAILILMLLAIGSLVHFTLRAQRLAEIQMQFVAGVSHEVRTPLTVIRNATYNLSHGVVNVNDPRQLERYLKLILTQAEKLTDIVEQVMRFATAKAGKVVSRRETVWVGPVIEEALAMSEAVLAQSRCVVEKNIDPALAPVLGDPVAIRHALQNLIGNASKYGADGGWIGITAENSDGQAGRLCVITVADRGPGIPMAEQKAIFDPFYRGRSAVDDQVSGAGLGLTLVRRIVEEQNGSIEVQSRPGEGAAFIMRFPALSPEQIDEFADTAD